MNDLNLRFERPPQRKLSEHLKDCGLIIHRIFLICERTFALAFHSEPCSLLAKLGSNRFFLNSTEASETVTVPSLLHELNEPSISINCIIHNFSNFKIFSIFLPFGLFDGKHQSGAALQL